MLLLFNAHGGKHTFGWMVQKKKNDSKQQRKLCSQSEAFSFHVHHAHSFYLGWNIFHLYIVCSSNLSFHVFFAPSQFNAFSSVYCVLCVSIWNDTNERADENDDRYAHTYKTIHLFTIIVIGEHFHMKFSRVCRAVFSKVLFLNFSFLELRLFFHFLSRNVLDGNSKWIQMCIILTLMMKMRRSHGFIKYSTAGCWICWDENLFRCWKLCFFHLFSIDFVVVSDVLILAFQSPWGLWLTCTWF